MVKAKKVGLWVLTVLLAVAFLGAGGSKLAGVAPHPESFVRWGFPLWFMYVTGATEVVAALLLLVPRTATLGAGLYVGTMVGAVLTHLKAGEASHVGAPIVFLVLAVVVGLARRHEVLPPFNRLFARGGLGEQVRA
ncbi:MAG TPA: DoxX family protein [Archangium sp.]|uniref:DoxX family protein n=1 Tax=Archangium sp. TaxID=1872627 RepID=UPI002E2F5A9A|nr:DoxX family protein [Archangium sp.]HEX5746374.1 DoxX family protein [Archangium sp.]